MAPASDPDRPVVVITGGEGVLGRAVATAFGASGFSVYAPGHRELDVTEPDAVSAYFSALPRIDLLVANAGIARDAPAARMTTESWNAVLQTNLSGAFRCARAAIRPMVKARSGHIVTVGSTSALTGPAGQANYAAAKAGLIGLTKSLAHELGSHGIRANCVLPGFLETPFTENVTDKRRSAVLADHTLGTFNTPAHAARFIVFLQTSLPLTSGQVFALDSRVLK